MEEQEKQERRPDIFSKVVRAGKRTYFFDVKTTRNGEFYLTITESKRRFLNDQGKFVYEKHKIFLYREDFEKFVTGLDGAIRYIETGTGVSDTVTEEEGDPDSIHVDVNFEDLGNDEEKAADE
jgi:hypothetical protein